MQCACAILIFVVCSAVQYFSTLSRKRTLFRKKFCEHKICFDFLYKFIWSNFYYKQNWARYDHTCISVFMNSAALHVQCCPPSTVLPSTYPSEFNETLIFSTDFRKMLRYQISWNTSGRSRVVQCSRRVRLAEEHSEANSYSSQFCQRD